MSDEWHEFYFMIGSSAGALIGLVFVVITLTARVDAERRALGARIYITPMIVHFVVVVLLSAAALVPDISSTGFGWLALVPSLCGLVYIAVVIWRFFGPLPAPPHWTDPIFYAALPALAYLVLTGSALAFADGWPYAPDPLAGAVVALLLIGIRDVWDLALWMSQHPDGMPD